MASVHGSFVIVVTISTTPDSHKLALGLALYIYGANVLISRPSINCERGVNFVGVVNCLAPFSTGYKIFGQPLTAASLTERFSCNYLTGITVIFSVSI